MPVSEPYIDSRNHCPFGCADEELDSLGYCVHLVGFSNDDETIEPVKFRKNGIHVVTGRRQFAEEVQKGDKIVNPLRVIKDTSRPGGAYESNTWVSSRVYRKATDEDKKQWIELHVFQFEPDTQAPVQIL